jgi:hypothetical protein
MGVKIFTSFKRKNFFYNYIIRLFLVNIFFIFLKIVDLNDAGLLSIESLFYSVNYFIFAFFSFFEFLIRLLDLFGLNINFIFFRININNLQFLINYYEVIIIYLLSYFSLILSVKKLKHINFERYKRYIRTLFLFLFIFFLFFFLYKTFVKENYKKKIHFALGQYKITRFFDVSITKVTHSNVFSYVTFLTFKNKFTEKHDYNKTYNDSNEDEILKGLKYFTNNYELKKYKNTYIVIAESFGEYKNKTLFNQLISTLVDQKELKLDILYRNWDRVYSTLGAEYEIFCDKRMKDDLSENIQEIKNCLSEFSSFNKIFMHTYLKNFNQRYIYENIFDKNIFYNEFINLGLKSNCKWVIDGICDHEALDYIKTFNESNKRNLIFFLTLNLHAPVMKFDSIEYNCEIYTETANNDEMCNHYFNTKTLFSSIKKNLIEEMSMDDLIIIYADTPPLFYERKHKKYFNYDKTPVLVIRK